MTVVELAVLVLFFLMAQKLADTYLGGYYSCPNCGARSSWRHSRDCPWRQRHPD